MRTKSMVVMIGVALSGLCACSSDRTPEVHAAANANAAVPAAAKDKSEYVTSGPLTVERQVDVTVERQGVVANILADVGERVHKGQVLAEFDARQLTADRDAADAKVKSTQFEFDHWKAEIKVRESDLARDEEMFKASLITAKQVEHSRYSVVGAQFESQREEQNLRNAQETLRSLELELEKTRVRAPFDGVVARRYIRVGQQVAVNDRAFWVSEMSPLNVKFTVPQEFAGKLKLGDSITVASQADPAGKEVAKLTRMSPVVDPSSGTIEVQAEVQGSGPALLPGMTVSIHVPVR